jgi:SAM-dependent methyltransferase
MDRHRDSLARIADRVPLRAWAPDTIDLPWGDPAFSERMLLEHLSQEHELASRRLTTIAAQTDRLVEWMGAAPREGVSPSVLDVTCGPGLFAQAFAGHGFSVTGVDISPAAIRAAAEITAGLPCRFIHADIRDVVLPTASFDAGVYLYGQAEVPAPDELDAILRRIRAALKPGAALALELRVASAVPRTMSTGWHTGVDGLFGSGTQLVLSERGWDAQARATVERHHVLDVESGELTIFGGTARALERDDWAAILTGAGFPAVEFHEAWDGLVFDDSTNWQVAIGR